MKKIANTHPVLLTAIWTGMWVALWLVLNASGITMATWSSVALTVAYYSLGGWLLSLLKRSPTQ